MKNNRESATSIALAEYCPRAAYISKIAPFGGKKSPNTTAGQIEHEYFEKILEMAKMDSTSKEKLYSPQLHEDRKVRANEFIQNLVLQSHPEFCDLARDTLDSLDYRVDIFHNNLLAEADQLFQDGKSLRDVRELIFPQKIEYWFENLEYRIVARVDLVYKASDGTLVIVDIKSHHSRIAALMHRDEHEVQMAVYAILAEKEFGIPVNLCRIFYSQDLSYEDFPISNELKSKVINLRNDLQNILGAPIPPLLEGKEKFRCKYCYKQELCSDLARNTDSAPIEYTPPGGNEID